MLHLGADDDLAGIEGIELLIPAIPIAQPRPRAVNVQGRSMLVSNPAKHPVTAFKATCQLIARNEYQGPPLDGPISLTIVFILPRPKVKIWKKQPMPRERHNKRPDLDNLVKSVVDALSGLLWRDDAQIYHVDASKFVASGEEQPHVGISVWQLWETIGVKES